MKRSLFDKLWDAHVVEELPGGNALVFMDLVVAHEITTPPGAIAIEKDFGDKLYDPDRIVAMIDHVAPAKDTATAIQAQTRAHLGQAAGIRFHDIGDNGICHVLVPERGYVTPGMTVCCGDSHTCTLGAFGAFALGIGTTAQAGAMLAGCLILQRPKVMRSRSPASCRPTRPRRTSPDGHRDDRLRGGTGYVLEYTGSAIARSRWTAHDAVQHGDRSGRDDRDHRADETTAAYLAATPARRPGWIRAAGRSRRGIRRDVTIDGARCGRSSRGGPTPARTRRSTASCRSTRRPESLAYMDLQPGSGAASIAIDQASSARARTRASAICAPRPPCCAAKGQRADDHHAGLAGVRRQAEREGLHDIFQDAGALWTHSSCGPCLGMSMGVLAPGRAASRRRTATSPAAWATADACTSPHPPSSPRRRSSAASPRPPRSPPAKRCRHDRRGPVLPIPRANIDTDQIIPAHYLTRIDAGMGEFCFERDARRRELLALHPGRRRCGSPARTSAAARRANTPRGRCSTRGFAP
jgi:3-isopropylmalate/(R)-2-methylmalate dehydratase large subunit